MESMLIDPADTVVLLLDHQNGLLQTVKDVPLAERWPSRAPVHEC
jgi:hypothetical protein